MEKYIIEHRNIEGSDEYSIMPLAGNVSMCECDNSSTSTAVLNLRQTVVTCDSTTTSDGTGKLPSNTTWTANGTGGSTNGATFSFAKNPDGSSRSATQTVKVKLKDKEVSDTLTFNQNPRRLSGYTTGTREFTITSVKLEIAAGTRYSCDNPTLSNTKEYIYYDWTQPMQAYDTCGDRWPAYDKTCSGTSSETKSRTVSHTFTTCDPNSSHTYTFSSQTYSTSVNSMSATSTVTVICENCIKFGLNRTGYTWSACANNYSGTHPTASATGNTSGKTIRYDWYWESGANFTYAEKNGANISNPYIGPNSCNMSTSSRSDVWRCECSVNGTVVDTLKYTVTQSGMSSRVACTTVTLSDGTGARNIDATGGTQAIKVTATSNCFTPSCTILWSHESGDRFLEYGESSFDNTVSAPCNSGSSRSETLRYSVYSGSTYISGSTVEFKQGGNGGCCQCDCRTDVSNGSVTASTSSLAWNVGDKSWKTISFTADTSAYCWNCKANGDDTDGRGNIYISGLGPAESGNWEIDCSGINNGSTTHSIRIRPGNTITEGTIAALAIYPSCLSSSGSDNFCGYTSIDVGYGVSVAELELNKNNNPSLKS